MEPRVGKVVNGTIVLEDTDGLVEGEDVTVWVGDPDEPVVATEAELELVRKGLAEIDRGDVLDARAFLAELRRRG